MIWRTESIVLVLGDLLVFLLSLWLSLFLRNLEIPTESAFSLHILPFSILFVVWIVVFYIAGLYEKHTIILKSKLPSVLANTQLANSAIAVVFFYFIPFFGITPKTILFIYLFISLVLVLLWRIYGYFVVGRGVQNNAIIVGSGDEMRELVEEVNNNPIYDIRFISSVDLNRADQHGFWDEIVKEIYEKDVSIIAIDLAHEKVEPVLPHLYNLIFSKVSFIDMHKIYEDIFDRVPISLLRYNWFLENISSTPRITYDTLKRIMDILVGVSLFVVSIPFGILAAIAIKLEDGGPVFISQERVGRSNKLIKIYKFRTMTTNDNGIYDGDKAEANRVTKSGDFLRKSRIDEFPQLINVIIGQLSLVGPRPELPALAKHYEEEVPYYNVRHIIKPGLSGWAQIYHEQHPHHGVDTVETKNKLSYDLYYIKNRSLLLDIKIALRTLNILLSRQGR